jgi:hypothetical protein
MVNGSGPATARARTKLVNCGQDTEITLDDGSTILLKGITEIGAVFPARGAPPAQASGQHPAPIGREIGGDGQ